MFCGKKVFFRFISGPTGQFAGGESQGGNGVGEAGAVHLHLQREASGLISNGPKLFRRVKGSPFRGLGNAQRPRFGIMDVGPFPYRMFHCVQVYLAVTAGDEEELGAVGEKFRSAALVRFQMVSVYRFSVTSHQSPVTGDRSPVTAFRRFIMRITPAIELEYRCSRMQLAMGAAGLDAVLVVQNADLFYFTGSVQAGCLYIPVQGQPLYLVRRDAGRARMESGLKEVLPFSSPRELPRIIAEYGYPSPRRVGLELDVLPVNLCYRYQAPFTGVVWLDASPLIRKLRMIKSSYEIHIMMDAGGQVDKLFRRVPEIVREGMTDLMLSAELEYVARTQGHPGFVRMRSFNGELGVGHVYSGTDSAVPTYTDTPLGGMGLSPSFGQGASYRAICRNEPIVVDFSGSFDGYLVDQTRIFALGPVSPRLQRAYDDMLALQELMKDTVQVGVGWGEIYDACRALATAQGHGDGFMGIPGSQVHFVGHGVGIEIDEYPLLARGFGGVPLEVGMAFAFEPKVVFPGEGAVGIENTFYLSGEGLKQLTVSDERLMIL